MRERSGTRGVLLITAGLIGSLLYVGSAGGVARFGDVEPERFYTEAVQWMVDNDITTGVSASCFAPNDSVTRGQAAAFIWRMEGRPGGSPPHPFVDVTAAYQQEAVSWMFAQAITTGTSGTTYSPADFLTRGQMAALIWRLAGNPTGSPPHPFNDVLASWQIPAVSWLFAQGITTGTTATTFSPDDTVTRGQLAAFFYRYKMSPAVNLDPSSPPCGTPPTPGDVKNCSDFDDVGAAQRYHDYYFPFYGDVANLDSDNDGEVCETLPTTTTTTTTTTSTTTTMGGGSTTTTTTTTTPPTTTISGGGSSLFNSTPGAGPTCANCHGSDGNAGNGGAPSLNPTSRSLSFIINQVTTGGPNGNAGMPSFAGRLTTDQINTVAQYVFNNEFP